MPVPRLFQAVAAGPAVWQRLAGLTAAGAEGRVVAVFGAVFYAELGPGLVCVATRRVEPGPLSILTSADAGLDWRHVGVAPDRVVLARAGALEMAGVVRIDLAQCIPWQPPAVAAASSARAIGDGLAALAAALPADPGLPGLGAFIRPGQRAEGLSREIAAAAAPVAAARAWAARALRSPASPPDGDPGWSARLIGLGPGLTPSGDDFLGGMLIALRAVGAGAARQRLWDAVRTLVPARTNAISAALLEAAARGHGGASLHRALNALLGGGAGLAPAVADLASIGHSSGWDALAGVAAVLEAARDARLPRAA